MRLGLRKAYSVTNLRTGPNRSERRERDSETKARSCCWIKSRFNWRNGSSFEGISEADFAELIRLARFSLGFMVIMVYSKLRFQSNNKIPNFESVYKDTNGLEGETRFRKKVFTTTRAREGCFVCERVTLFPLRLTVLCSVCGIRIRTFSRSGHCVYEAGLLYLEIS